MKLFFFLWIVFGTATLGLSQSMITDFPVLGESLRRGQLLGEVDSTLSFGLRPVNLTAIKADSELQQLSRFWSGRPSSERKTSQLYALPILSTSAIHTKRPYGWGDKGLNPNVGFQTYLGAGLYGKAGFFEAQFYPEFTFSENRPYQGFQSDFPTSVIQSRFFYWNDGDNPELFGDGPSSQFWWGQSYVKLSAGPVSLKLSTENIWWGPGQFNALIFSDNAQGFPHLSLETNRPIRTFLGNFETQIIMGRLENSQRDPSQNSALNAIYFEPFDGDWRYLNGISINYNPSFLPNAFIGFNRTFQQYDQVRGDSFNDWFPIFEVFQKERFFDDGNTIVYDSRGQDQQVSVSLRYLVPSAQFEIYSEFGRRDHSFNWREFILNPEHARAYLVGFQKLFQTGKPNRYLQVRGEMTHQQESVNRYIRYPGLIGNQTWHTHGLARGFVNYGQTLGVGSGVGANVQTLEIASIRGMNKLGLRLERLENHQDFFYRAFGQNDKKRPWIDLSAALLFDKSWERLIFSSQAQFIYAQNYQWISSGIPSAEFPSGKNLFSFFGTFHLVYSLSANKP
ncbi:capsule assembly Wzi family protein [Algoriphagus namhaensis]